MTCDQAIELLPWLLNGTLEAAERDEIRRHLATCEPCRSALAATRDVWEIFGQHLASADLVSLAWGEAPTGVDPGLAESHLASCARCAAELELARMSRHLEEEGNVTVFPGPKGERRPVAATASETRFRVWRAAALAASLAAVVALGGWIQSAFEAPKAVLAEAPVAAPPAAPSGNGGEAALQQKLARLQGDFEKVLGLQQENDRKLAEAQEQVARLEGQQALLAQPHGADIVMLEAVVRGGGEDGGRVRAGAFSSLLIPAGGATGPGTAEILDAAGKAVLTVGDLRPAEEHYAVVLTPGALKPGRYTIRLNGQGSAGAFQVVP